MSGAMNMMAMGMMSNMMGGNGMANMMGGQQASNVQQMPQTQNSGAAPILGWTCSCGHVNTGKFCQECGKKKPEGAPLYKCDKCGWEPEDPAHPPKFCPECGDVFDDNDRI